MDVFNRASETTPVVYGALTYIATSNPNNNKNWLGPAPVESIARQIATAVGPSGPNYVYLYRLAATMREVLIV